MTQKRVIRRRIKESQRQERAGMDRLGGVRHRGSGNGSRKGDGRVDSPAWYEQELIEFKRTDNQKQITIKVDDLEKISREAAVLGRIPGLVFEVNGKSYVIHEESDWIELKDRGAHDDCNEFPESSDFG